MNNWYIDLGSSTIKVYEFSDKLKLIEEFSIYFKNGFSEDHAVTFIKIGETEYKFGLEPDTFKESI